MLSAKGFLIGLWTLFVVVMLVFVGLIIAADPQNYFIIAGIKPHAPMKGVVTAAGWSWPIPHGSNTAKVLNLITYKPDVVVIGSSTVWSNVDVNHPGIRENWEKSYNFGIPAINAETMNMIVKHTLILSPPKKMVIGLEYPMFIRYRFLTEYFDQIPLAQDPLFKKRVNAFLISNIFTQDYVVEALGSLWNGFIKGTLTQQIAFIEGKIPSKLKRPQAAPPPSSSTPLPAVPEVCNLMQTQLNGEKLMVNAFYPEKKLRTAAHADLRLSVNLAQLQEIIAMAKAQQVKLYLYISPVHVRSLEHIRLLGFWPQYQNWLRGLVQIAGDVPVWDFASYNEITTEEIPLCGYMKNYVDTFHARTEINNLMFDKMFNVQSTHEKIPGDFGVRLTLKNIEQHITTLEQGHLQYVRQHKSQIGQLRKELDL